ACWRSTWKASGDRRLRHSASLRSTGNGSWLAGLLPFDRPNRMKALLALGRLEGQRHAIDAIALAGGVRPVLGHRAQMAAAFGAMHLDPQHAQAAVLAGGDGALARLPETRPAGAAVELGGGIEQGLTAAGAVELTGPLFEVQRAGARPLGAVA